MKTQIITLAGHDDLISVRDRMSWAKSPRILLVWPAYEQVPLRPLDLRILQQHARELGAQLGLVTRRTNVRRDAEAFGIPTFRTSAEAQRGLWARRQTLGRSSASRGGSRVVDLRETRARLRQAGTTWSSRPFVRVFFFAIAVLAVCGLASLFVPRATIELSPISKQQNARLEIEVSSIPPSSVLTGVVPAREVHIEVSGTQTTRVHSQSEVPTSKAIGTVRFQSLADAPALIPSGTVVYSLAPSAVRFATLAEARLDAGDGGFAEVPVESLEAGEIGNLPANALQGVEGILAASVSVTNPAPTTGGVDAAETVPSQSDRAILRASLLEQLEAEAQAGLGALVDKDDVILPAQPALDFIAEEIFDPPTGQPGSVLGLTMGVTYSATYVKGSDLRALAELTLNSSLPPEFAARPGTLEYRIVSSSTSTEGRVWRLELEASRTIVRRLDADAVNQSIRGKSTGRALADVQSTLTLSAPPEIRLSPPWWPWLPLVPFRISVVID